MAVLLVMAAMSGAATGPEPLAPFTGVIKNNTKYELSIPSDNSLGTIIVPPKGWVEFVVWDNQFDLIPYREGQPFRYGCQKVTVKPQAYPFMCKNYDFVAEINAPEPRTGKTYKKKRYRKKRNPC